MLISSSYTRLSGLFQKNNIPVNQEYMVNSTTDIIHNIIHNCLDSQTHFVFYKTKK